MAVELLTRLSVADAVLDAHAGVVGRDLVHWQPATRGPLSYSRVSRCPPRMTDIFRGDAAGA